MKIRTFRRHVRDALRAFWRNRWMSLAAVSTVAVTLFLVGVFLLAAMNINHFTHQIEQQVEIRVFLHNDASQDAVRALEREIRAMPEVDSVQFIPKDEGLTQLKADYRDMADLFEGLEDDNPLPDAFRIKTKNPQDTAPVAERIAAMPFVEKVRYGKDVIDQLFQMTAVLRTAMLILVVGLALTAMFLIANTIRLTIVYRQDEIEVMRLVGATKMYIRWPFFIEGALIGLIGAVLPLLVLTYGYDAFLSRLKFAFVSFLPFEDVVQPLVVLLIGIGLVIGISGTLSSIRKYLRV